jgi:hypothetical protein
MFAGVHEVHSVVDRHAGDNDEADTFERHSEPPCKPHAPVPGWRDSEAQPISWSCGRAKCRWPPKARCIPLVCPVLTPAGLLKQVSSPQELVHARTVWDVQLITSELVLGAY